MQGDALRVKILRQRLCDSAGAAGFLARKKTETASVLPVLEELTRRLPDDTWLERFTLSATGQLGFQGQSPQAARLIDALKGARAIGDPSFQGTIQTDPTSGKERFYMQAKALIPKPETATQKPAAAAVPAGGATVGVSTAAPSSATSGVHASAPASEPGSASASARTAPNHPAATDGKEAPHAHEAR
jgi:general secretion pathway protein L